MGGAVYQVALGTALVGGLLSTVPTAAAPLDDSVLTAINRLRADPPAFAVTLRRFRASLDRFGVYRGREERAFRLAEGVRAVDEAIAVLDRQRPLPPLVANPLLARMAAAHSAAQGPTGAIGHVDPAGDFEERLAGFRIEREAGEVISYGHATAEGVVIQLIIDDGVSDRGHRAELLNPSRRFAGAGCGPHARFGTMCTVDLTGPPAP